MHTKKVLTTQLAKTRNLRSERSKKKTSEGQPFLYLLFTSLLQQLLSDNSSLWPKIYVLKEAKENFQTKTIFIYLLFTTLLLFEKD